MRWRQLVADNGASLPADPEEQLPLIHAYRRHVSDVVLRQGGTIGEMRGREVLAFFGHPIAQEHAADRAIHTGLVLTDKRPTAQLAVKQKSAANGESTLPAGLAVRVAIASGVVVAGPADGMLGEAPSEAVRLLHQAEPNQVIISASTYPLVDGLFVCLGLSPSQSGRPEQTWQVLGPSTLGSRSEALFSENVAPLVGREEELALLLRAWQSSSAERAAALETRAQLERGLEFAASLPGGPERDELEAELLLALANILQTTTSMSSAEAASILDRAVPICRRLARTPLLSRALWGQFVCVLVLGRVAAAQTISRRIAAVGRDPVARCKYK